MSEKYKKKLPSVCGVFIEFTGARFTLFKYVHILLLSVITGSIYRLGFDHFISISCGKKKVCQSSLVHSRVEPNTRDHPSKFQNRVIIFKYIKNYYDDNQILIHVLSNLYFIPNSSFRIAQLKILIQVRDSHAILLTEIPLQMSRVSIWNSRLVNLTLVGMEGLNTTESVVMMKEWWLGF